MNMFNVLLEAASGGLQQIKADDSKNIEEQGKLSDLLSSLYKLLMQEFFLKKIHYFLFQLLRER